MPIFGSKPTTTAQVPNDLGQSRNDTIGLARFLLGFPGANQPGAPSSGPGGAVGGAQNYWQQQGQRSDNSPTGGLNGPAPGGFQAGGVPQMGGQPQGGFGGQMLPAPQPRVGGQAFGGPMPQAPQGMDFGQATAPGSPGSRVESVFGQTGVQATPLQRQSSGGISQFLNQPSPETRTMDALNPGLMNLFNQQLGTPGSIQNSLSGLQQGGNPLQGQLNQFSQALGGQLQGQNPLPQNAQNTLNQGLQTDLAGGLRESLQGLLSGQGGGSQFQQMFQGGPQQGDTSAIQNELNYNPNQQLLDALQPRFQQNLALADQAGGRFGSANALQRAQATNDYNLMAAQGLQQDLARRAGLASNLANANVSNAGQANSARLGFGQLGQSGQLGAANTLLNAGQASGQLQQGAASLLGQGGQQALGNQQNVAQLLGQLGLGGQGLGQQGQLGANQLLGNLGLGYNQLNQQGQLGAGQLQGQLAGQAGQNDFSRLLGAFGIGSQQAQQNDVGTSRNLAILAQQLGGLNQATLGAPVSTTPSGNQQAMGVLGQALSVLPFLGL